MLLSKCVQRKPLHYMVSRPLAVAMLLATPCIRLTGARADVTASSSGESSYHRAARFVSGPGTFALIAGSVVLPLLDRGKDGKNESLRTVDALLVTGVATELLKATTGLKRPNGDKDGFPSGHTSAAFAAATMASHFHPKQAPLWYLGATLIGASRVELRAHHTYQVVAGAALGYGISRLELGRPRGLLLSPFIKPGSSLRAENTVGLQVTKAF